ncbi:MAG: 3-phosphoshikimate 1-carboxyvinyltransferase, partial [Pseudomonadota bacterium]
MSGAVHAPGDKSCSHRALIFGALAEGESTFKGVLEGEDVLQTAEAVRALGASVRRSGPGAWRITGARWRSPEAALDFGNSGTGSRLMMGAMAGFPLRAALRGDASLSARPMGRVLAPLRQMGLKTEPADADRLPLDLVSDGRLSAIRFAPPQASAQVKSAILLAGLNAEGVTEVAEAKATRDHTERMLRGFGAEIGVRRTGGGATVSIEGGQSFNSLDAVIPGDPSSESFLSGASFI